jgi:leucyl/phenylalanyl-tRNA--protein transferase
MFHYKADASKVGLVALVERLRTRGFLLLDTQWMTPHLAQFGTFVVPKSNYLQLLTKAIATPCLF